MRESTTRQRLAALIATGFQPAAARIGLDVYQRRTNRGSGHELTIGEAAGQPVACLYVMEGSRRILAQIWDIAS